jgi:hypothetical protein
VLGIMLYLVGVATADRWALRPSSVRATATLTPRCLVFEATTPDQLIIRQVKNADAFKERRPAGLCPTPPFASENNAPACNAPGGHSILGKKLRHGSANRLAFGRAGRYHTVDEALGSGRCGPARGNAPAVYPQPQPRRGPPRPPPPEQALERLGVLLTWWTRVMGGRPSAAECGRWRS